MKPENQQLAILRLLGWKTRRSVRFGELVTELVTPNGSVNGFDYGGHDDLLWWFRYDDTFPDYLNDLNAMHEAEKMFTHAFDTCSKYQSTLAEVCGSDGYAPEAQFLFHATAAQRAEAFLRTQGLWKDDEVVESNEPIQKYSLRDEGRNPDGSGESYAERNL